MEFDPLTILPVVVRCTDYATQYNEKIKETKSVTAMRSNNLQFNTLTGSVFNDIYLEIGIMWMNKR